MNYSNLMDAVNARIKANGRREITGDILNDVLRAMVVELGAGYQLGGTIRPGDKPKDEDLRVAYLAVEPGMYLYVGGFEVTELSLITYGTEWYMYPLGVPFGSQIAEDIAAAVEVEKTRAMAAEKDLSDAIDTEKTERAAADSALDSAIKAETKRAKDAEGVLTKALDDEKTRAMAAEGANAAAIASEADARAQADTTLQGNITAEATAREAADEAMAAKVTAEEATRKAADATLQANINTEESERKAADTALGTRVASIEDKIPAQASSENKLADKDFVNSSIATSTATFRGTFDTLEALKAAQADKNDYAFWVHKDENGNTCYDKYTYTGTEWKFEYRLNNSSFTAAQWAALNSGVTADVIKALQDADKANAKAIADEKAERIAAVAAEQTAREQADTANAEAITTETAGRKAADQTLQDNINKKVSKDDETWLENLMPRIWLNPYGKVGTITVGDSLAVDYADARWRLSKYGGTVTPYDDESVHGRVVQVKELNNNKLYVTAIFNNGADFSDNFANSLYEIILTFGANGAFSNGTYTVKPLGRVFTLHLYAGQFEETAEAVADVITDKGIIFQLEVDLGDGDKTIYPLNYGDFSVGGTLYFGTFDAEAKSVVSFEVYTNDMSYDKFEEYFLSREDYERIPVILNYNGLSGNNEPIFVYDDGTALTRLQICALLNGVNANRVVLKNKASAVMQNSSAKFLQCNASEFMIGFEGANASGQIFDILYKWDATGAEVLRAELLYNPQA